MRWAGNIIVVALNITQAVRLGFVEEIIGKYSKSGQGNSKCWRLSS